MNNKSNSNPEVNKDTNVTRSQQQQAQKVAGQTSAGNENRPEGLEYKGTPEHTHGSHAEGEYPRQSDDPTMHPSDIDEKK